MQEIVERTQLSLERSSQAQCARLDSMLAAVTASNENIVRIGQALTRDETYNGGLASTLPLQLPKQLVPMAPAMSTVQPQGVALPMAIYQAAPPLLQYSRK